MAGNDNYESGWGNVLLVSNITLPDSVVDVFQHAPADAEVSDEPDWWFCSSAAEFYRSCDAQSLAGNGSSWTIPLGYATVDNYGAGYLAATSYENMWAGIEYCLVSHLGLHNFGLELRLYLCIASLRNARY